MLRSTITPADPTEESGGRWENRAASRSRTEGGDDERDVRDREVLEDAADRWWIFLVTGIAWLVFALHRVPVGLHDRCPRSRTCSASSPSFAGVNEFLEITVSTTGWKWVHGSSACCSSRRHLRARPSVRHVPDAGDAHGPLPARQGRLRHHASPS